MAEMARTEVQVITLRYDNLFNQLSFVFFKLFCSSYQQNLAISITVKMWHSELVLNVQATSLHCFSLFNFFLHYLNFSCFQNSIRYFLSRLKKSRIQV